MKITLDLTPEQLKEVKKILKEDDGFWEPKVGEKYHHYNVYIGEFCTKKNIDDSIDRHLILSGRAFRTEQDCINHNKKEEAIQEIKRFISNEIGTFNPDWNNIKQNKFIIYHNHEEGKYACRGYCLVQKQSLFGYLKSYQDAQKVIENCKKDLDIIFNVK